MPDAQRALLHARQVADPVLLFGLRTHERHAVASGSRVTEQHRTRSGEPDAQGERRRGEVRHLMGGQLLLQPPVPHHCRASVLDLQGRQDGVEADEILVVITPKQNRAARPQQGYDVAGSRSAVHHVSQADLEVDGARGVDLLVHGLESRGIAVDIRVHGDPHEPSSFGAEAESDGAALPCRSSNLLLNASRQSGQ